MMVVLFSSFFFFFFFRSFCLMTRIEVVFHGHKLNLVGTFKFLSNQDLGEEGGDVVVLEAPSREQIDERSGLLGDGAKEDVGSAMQGLLVEEVLEDVLLLGGDGSVEGQQDEGVRVGSELGLDGLAHLVQSAPAQLLDAVGGGAGGEDRGGQLGGDVGGQGGRGGKHHGAAGPLDLRRHQLGKEVADLGVG